MGLESMGEIMTFDERTAEKAQAYIDRAKKVRRSREDLMQGRLIPESPDIDIGV